MTTKPTMNIGWVAAKIKARNPKENVIPGLEYLQYIEFRKDKLLMLLNSHSDNFSFKYD